MKATLRTRLDGFQERFEELAALLAEPDVIADQARFRDYSREYAELEPLIEAWRSYRRTEDDLEAAEQMREHSPSLPAQHALCEALHLRLRAPCRGGAGQQTWVASS